MLTEEASGKIPQLKERPVLSFSGGVADCIDREHPWTAFGDIGPLLGQAIRNSALCAEEYRLGSETIRATVIGAGCHATQLSGSTVFFRNVRFPIKNVPVYRQWETAAEDRDGPRILALEIPEAPDYSRIRKLAEELAAKLRPPVLLCMERDAAKALGQALALRLPEDTPLLCIDRIRVKDGDYLDIGQPVGGALPVVVKTLVWGKEDRSRI